MLSGCHRTPRHRLPSHEIRQNVQSTSRSIQKGTALPTAPAIRPKWMIAVHKVVQCLTKVRARPELSLYNWNWKCKFQGHCRPFPVSIHVGRTSNQSKQTTSQPNPPSLDCVMRKHVSTWLICNRRRYFNSPRNPQA